MNSVVLALIGVAMMLLGYFLYSKYLSKRIYKLDEKFETPAHTQRDGVDYVPTNKFVLWGHHFTSVAGAAPIVGPAVAVIWGWLPAFLWVTLGTVFFAGMHDLGALWASVRHRGQSIGTLSGRYIGSNGRNLFLVVIFLLLLMVNAAFAVVITNLLLSTPSSVIPTGGALVVALLVGQAIYRFRWNLVAVSIVGVVALYGLIILGDAYPVVLPETILGLSSASFWVIVLFLYAGLASILPVWVLLQPRDYINGLQLFIGLGILYVGVLIASPSVVAPAYNSAVPEGTPSIVPLLFVTIACGAISGFHGIVSSGTSSKQLDKETDARFSGYFGAVGEGLLAPRFDHRATAGFKSVMEWKRSTTPSTKGSRGVRPRGWFDRQPRVGHPHLALGNHSRNDGGAIRRDDDGYRVRLQRFVVQEASDILGFKIGKGVATIGAHLRWASRSGRARTGRAGWSSGRCSVPRTSLMAALTLAILAVILTRKRRPTLPILIPMIFVGLMTLYALVVQLGQFYSEKNWLLFGHGPRNPRCLSG